MKVPTDETNIWSTCMVCENEPADPLTGLGENCASKQPSNSSAAKLLLFAAGICTVGMALRGIR